MHSCLEDDDEEDPTLHEGLPEVMDVEDLSPEEQMQLFVQRSRQQQPDQGDSHSLNVP